MSTNTDQDSVQPNTNAEACIDAGIGLAQIENRITEVEVDGVDVPVALTPNGMTLHVLADVIKAADERAQKPRRLRGTATHHELESFITHLNAFKDPASVVFADVNNVKLTAVFDYNVAGAGTEGENVARWGQHRSVYACPLSAEWKRWTGANEQWMGQDKFAQFIEDNMVDLANPSSSDYDVMPKPAAVLEMARKLSINIQGEFKREINQTTGESTLINKTEHGPNSTKIFKAFVLGIPVFEAGEKYRVEARLRFTIADGPPKFSYALYQSDAIKRDAFGEVRAKVAAATDLPVYAGSPEA